MRIREPLAALVLVACGRDVLVTTISSSAATGAGGATSTASTDAASQASSASSGSGQGGSGQGGSGDGGSAVGAGGDGGGGFIGACVAGEPDRPIVCPDDACLVIFDSELACDDPLLAASGVDVVAPGSRTFFTTTEGRTRLYEVVGGAPSVVEGFELDAPGGAAVRLTHDGLGALYVVGDETDADRAYAEGLVLVSGSPEDGFERATVFDLPDRYTRLVSMETADGRPHVWFDSDPEVGEVSLAVPDGGGGFDLEVAPWPGDHGLRAFVATPSPVAIGLEQTRGGLQIVALDSGSENPLGAPIYAGSGWSFRAIPPYHESAAHQGPPYGALVQEPAGTRIAVLELFGGDVALPGLEPPSRVCADSVIVREVDGCPAPCHEDAEGVELLGASAVLTWLGSFVVAAVRVTYDHDVVYESVGCDAACACAGERTNDRGTAELLILRHDAGTRETSVLLRTPFSPLAFGGFAAFDQNARILDLAVTESDVALVARVAGPEGPAVRVARIAFPGLLQ